MLKRVEAASGDIVFFGAGPQSQVNHTMHALLTRLGQQELLSEGFHPLWVTDFPMFEVTHHGVKSMHHPLLTQPVAQQP